MRANGDLLAIVGYPIKRETNAANWAQKMPTRHAAAAAGLDRDSARRSVVPYIMRRVTKECITPRDVGAEEILHLHLRIAVC